MNSQNHQDRNQIDRLLKKKDLLYHTTFSDSENKWSLLNRENKRISKPNCFAIQYTSIHRGRVIPKFIIFDNISDFYQLLLQVDRHNRTFCQIFTSKQRSFYIDIDHYSCPVDGARIALGRNEAVAKYIVEELLKLIVDLRAELPRSDVDISHEHVYLFTASRINVDGRLKTSVHILIDNLIFANPTLMAAFVMKIQQLSKQLKSPIDEYVACIDKSVYCGDHYQLWRMPSSIKMGEPDSEKLWVPVSVSQIENPPNLLQLILINQCNAKSAPVARSKSKKSALHPSTHNKLSIRSAKFIHDQSRQIDESIKLISREYDRSIICGCVSIGNENVQLSVYRSNKNKLQWTEWRCTHCHQMIDGLDLSFRCVANIEGSKASVLKLLSLCQLMKVTAVNQQLYIFKASKKSSLQFDASDIPQHRTKQLDFSWNARIRCHSSKAPARVSLIKIHPYCGQPQVSVYCCGCSSFHYQHLYM